jgi:hypothetical protein
VLPVLLLQSAARIQSENPARVEAFELETPAVKTVEVDALLTDKDIAVRMVTAGQSCSYTSAATRTALGSFCDCPDVLNRVADVLRRRCQLCRDAVLRSCVGQCCFLGMCQRNASRMQSSRCATYSRSVTYRQPIIGCLMINDCRMRKPGGSSASHSVWFISAAALLVSHAAS